MNRRQILAASGVGALAAASLTSCTPPKSKVTRKTIPLGERAEAGTFVYVALETNWTSQLGFMPNVRVPKHHFLAVRISITNQGGQQAGSPLLTLVDDSDKQYPEVDDAKDLEGWMGLVRMIAPAGTEFGWVLFDVPPNSYALRVTDGNVENEKVAFIDLPLRMA